MWIYFGKNCVVGRFNLFLIYLLVNDWMERWYMDGVKWVDEKKKYICKS